MTSPFGEQTRLFAFCVRKRRSPGHAPLVFQQIDDPAVGNGSVPVIPHDLVDGGDPRQFVREPRPVRFVRERALVVGDRLFVIALSGLILRRFVQADGVVFVRGDERLHDAIGLRLMKPRQRDMRAVDLVLYGAGIL